jgi:hypothetical protein
MTEQELRQAIHKAASVLIDRAREIKASSEWGPLDEALDGVLSKAGSVQDDAWQLWNDVTDWRRQQSREKNSQ